MGPHASPFIYMSCYSVVWYCYGPVYYLRVPPILCSSKDRIFSDKIMSVREKILKAMILEENMVLYIGTMCVLPYRLNANGFAVCQRPSTTFGIG